VAGYIITLGLGSPTGIPQFILVGLSPGEGAPFVPFVTIDLRATLDQNIALDSAVSQTFGGRSILDAAIDLQGDLH
jgi:hypothetical protein